MKRQKVFFNDLLALALAGIVSLLFTHGITQFVNSNKKQDHSAVSASRSVGGVDTSERIESSRDLNSPVAGFGLECNLFVHEKSVKLLRQAILDIVWDWKRVRLPRFWSRQEYNQFREISTPSIPITLCKLLI
jgi:hypothetical protein